MRRQLKLVDVSDQKIQVAGFCDGVVLRMSDG
jgi:hypothetical protein